MTVLELAVQDLDGYMCAAHVGAHRVEMCAALGATGGVTPSIGLVEQCAAAEELAAEGGSAPEQHVLVRPRQGDFVLSSNDVDSMVRDIAAVAAAGARGVVIGALTSENEIDVAAMRTLTAHAQRAGLEVTFHRAFDVIANRLEALEQLVELGVTRILTSGGAPHAGDATDVLAELVAASAARIQIQAGGGVRVADVPALVNAGVDGIHLSAKTWVKGGPAGPGGGESRFERTDATVARAAAAALAAATRRSAPEDGAERPVTPDAQPLPRLGGF